MKNISLAINGVLFAGLAVLYFLHFSASPAKTNASTSANEAMAGSTTLKIAYVNIDSILFQYGLSIELNDAITKKQSGMKSRLEKEASDFQKEAQVFQDKVQRGIFLTQQRAEEAQQKLVSQQQELQQLQADYSDQLAQDQQKMNQQLFDSITNYINQYNTPEKYQFILGHSLGGNMLYGSKYLDITKEVLAGLNERYNNDKKK